MTQPHRSVRAALSVVASLAAMLAGGCATTDPAPDIASAASLADERLGRDADSSRSAWTTAWDAPARWDGSTPLSAQDAVAIALERRRELRAALAEIAMARAELAGEETPPNPLVSFAYGANLDVGAGSMITAGAMAQLSWLWQRDTKVAAAEARLRQRVLQAADEALATVAEVRAQHLGVLAAEAMLARAIEADDAAARRVTLVTALEERGALSAVERRMAEEARRMRRDERIAAELELHHAKVMLLESLALSELDATWSTDGAWPDGRDPADAETLAAHAPEQRLDVAAMAAGVRVAEAEARAAGLEGLPEIELGAMFERGMDGGEVLGPSIAARVPLFNQGQPAQAKAAAGLDAARLELDMAIHRARSDARDRAMEWRSATSVLEEIAKPRAAATGDDLAAIRELRSRGAESELAECEAIAMHAEAEGAMVKARMDAAIAAIRFERSMGGFVRNGGAR